MWKQDRDETQERYRERWLQHGYDSRSLGWNKDCQWVRFEAAFEGLRKEDFDSIIDFGCGFGDLLGYLRMKEWPGSYTGVDLVDELITEAAKRHELDNRAAFTIPGQAVGVARAFAEDFELAGDGVNAEAGAGELPAGMVGLVVGVFLGVFDVAEVEDAVEAVKVAVGTPGE